MFNKYGNFYNYNEFCYHYEVNLPVTCFNGIRRSILVYYSKLSELRCHLNTPFLPRTIKTMKRCDKGTKEFYNIFIRQIKPNTNYITKWKTDLNVLDDNNDNQLIKSISYVFKITSDTTGTLRWFQYRISHRILATNDFLYKIHINNSNLCTLCNTETEKIMHLFVDCECVEIIWNMLENWLYDKCDFLLNYNKREILEISLWQKIP